VTQSAKAGDLHLAVVHRTPIVRVLAGLPKVHPDIDQTYFLTVAERVVAAEDPLVTEITSDESS
jgi:hypothetical protein